MSEECMRLRTLSPESPDTVFMMHGSLCPLRVFGKGVWVLRVPREQRETDQYTEDKKKNALKTGFRPASSD